MTSEHHDVGACCPVPVSRRTLLRGFAGGGALAALGGFGNTPATASPRRRGRPAARTRVVLLGTAGGPVWWGVGRAGPASAFVVGDRYYLVDAGEGVGGRLRQAGLGAADAFVRSGPLDALAGVFLTHLHSDHVADLTNLLSLGAVNGLPQADRPVAIWGPGDRGRLPALFGPPPAPPVTAPDRPTPGTAEMVSLFVRALATDFNDRAFDNRRPVPADLFVGRDVVLPPGLVSDPNVDPHPPMGPVVVMEDDRVRVTTTLVSHGAVHPALAYRFDSDDGSAVFSGDTAPSENLVRLAAGADVLVHEVIAADWVDSLLPSPRSPQDEAVRQHLIGAHTTIEQVGPIAEEAGVRTLVLNHLSPADWPARLWRRASRGFSGELVVPDDLDEVAVGRHR